MANKFRIPDKELEKIRLRDLRCVYCHCEMKEHKNSTGTPFDKATIEHMHCYAPFNVPSTVVICCGACNSSRGAKTLLKWFLSQYCVERNINTQTVAKPVQQYLEYTEGFVSKLEWRFAKTMPEIPHEYIVRDNLSNKDKTLFDRLATHIKEQGYIGKFALKTYWYIDIGDYKYWVIDNILNREPLTKAA